MNYFSIGFDGQVVEDSTSMRAARARFLVATYVFSGCFTRGWRELWSGLSERWRIQEEVPPSGFLSLSAPRRRCRTSKLQAYRVQEYRLPTPPSFKCNVLRESLSGDSKITPYATLKRRGSWVISVYLCMNQRERRVDVRRGGTLFLPMLAG
jgi:hypothetical protein